MSMSRGCITVEWKKNEFYCITAQDEYDYNFKRFEVTGSKKTAREAFLTHDGCNPGAVEEWNKDGKTLAKAYPVWVLRAIRKYKKELKKPKYRYNPYTGR